MLPKPVGTIRILCVGASTTNEGVDTATNYPNTIEAKLRQVLSLNPVRGIDRIEVINCGVDGISSSSIYHRFADYLALEPDMVVLLEGINDLMITTLPSPLVRPQSALRRAAAEWSDLYLWLDPEISKPVPDIVRIAIQGTTISYFEAFVERMRNCNIPVAICTVPKPDPDYLSEAAIVYLDNAILVDWHCERTTYRDYDGATDLLNEELSALAARQGCVLIPLDIHFNGILGSLHTYYDICHMYPLGWNAKAQCTANYLAPLLPLLAEQQ